MRARNTYPTRGVRELREPLGVRLRGADFPQYRQIDQRARKNDIASAPEFQAKRPICTMQYALRTLHRVMAPDVSNRLSKKQQLHILLFVYSLPGTQVGTSTLVRV